MPVKRVLLLLPTTGYRNADFLAAARKLGVEVLAAANYCHRLAPSWGFAPIMALHFDLAQHGRCGPLNNCACRAIPRKR